MNKRIFKKQTSSEGEIPFYKISTFGKKADAFISRELFEKYKKEYPYPQKGDILISASGTLGRFIEYNGEDAYYQDSNIVWLEHNKKLTNEYLRAYYQQIRWNTSEGSTIQRLYNKSILSTHIGVPKITEQIKIGKLIRSMDNLLTLQQRKLEQLINIRKGLLTTIFNKIEGKKVRLGDIVTFINGRAYRQNELLSTGKYPVIRVGNFYTNSEIYYSNLELDDSKYLYPGDLIYTWSATFGPHIWKENKKVIYHYHIWKLKFDNNAINKNFLYYLLLADKQKLTDNTNGSTLIHITKHDMEEKYVIIPNIDKQIQIGEFFGSIDNLISNFKDKLNKLKNIKKFLLQNMFI